MSTAKLRSVSRRGRMNCPFLSISGLDLWKLWRENCHMEICTAKARAEGMAVPPTMHCLTCAIFQFKWKKMKQALSSRKKKYFQGDLQIFKAPETWEWVETCDFGQTIYILLEAVAETRWLIPVADTCPEEFREEILSCMKRENIPVVTASSCLLRLSFYIWLPLGTYLCTAHSFNSVPWEGELGKSKVSFPALPKGFLWALEHLISSALFT